MSCGCCSTPSFQTVLSGKGPGAETLKGTADELFTHGFNYTNKGRTVAGLLGVIGVITLVAALILFTNGSNQIGVGVALTMVSALSLLYATNCCMHFRNMRSVIEQMGKFRSPNKGQGNDRLKGDWLETDAQGSYMKLDRIQLTKRLGRCTFAFCCVVDHSAKLLMHASRDPAPASANPPATNPNASDK